jgi:hypothetical protein
LVWEECNLGTCLKFYLKTSPGERVETELTLPENEGTVITGTVTRKTGEPAAGVLILVMDSETMQPICHCVSDAQGIFAVGPLPAALYHIHIYDGATPVRIVKIKL